MLLIALVADEAAKPAGRQNTTYHLPLTYPSIRTHARQIHAVLIADLQGRGQEGPRQAGAGDVGRGAGRPLRGGQACACGALVGVWFGGVRVCLCPCACGACPRRTRPKEDKTQAGPAEPNQEERSRRPRASKQKREQGIYIVWHGRVESRGSRDPCGFVGPCCSFLGFVLCRSS